MAWRKATLAALPALALLAACDGSSSGVEGPNGPVYETYGYSADSEAEGIELGRQVYTQWCAICHESGAGMGGTDALMRKYRGELSPLLREREDLTPQMITSFVRQGVKSMPSFRKTEISDEQMEALALYLTEGSDQAPGGRLTK